MGKDIYAQEWVDISSYYFQCTSSSIFLAGPTPRDTETMSWRPGAVKILRDLGYQDDILIPESRDGTWNSATYQKQIDWELYGLERADIIMFWIPRDLITMPGFTTNVEFGMYVSSGRVVLGFPEDAPKMKYLHSLAIKKGRSLLISHTLENTCSNALKLLECEGNK